MKKNHKPKRYRKLFIVEDIRNKRINQITGKVEYQIKWKDWQQKDNTWEPIDHLRYIQNLITIFEGKINNQQKNNQSVLKSKESIKQKQPTQKNNKLSRRKRPSKIMQFRNQINEKEIKKVTENQEITVQRQQNSQINSMQIIKNSNQETQIQKNNICEQPPKIQLLQIREPNDDLSNQLENTSQIYTNQINQTNFNDQQEKLEIIDTKMKNNIIYYKVKFRMILNEYLQQVWLTRQQIHIKYPKLLFNYFMQNI